ncbi:MAG: DUF523 and DUF1722 domain-containing protein [Gammaproteobacteria bacterium SHHR-1]|uniref:YbgA family protein n=1 Tax=Magnetovirga frankeli TaxID=947516 RepID=UPI001293A817|nr:DUF523 and DUF1722 domain-containing protein [gamma proteobacterium SS-5]
MNHKPKIGVSACLLGQAVRYDGGHCRNQLVTDRLARFAELEAFCPETGIGLPVPRPTLHLRRRQGQIRLVQTRDAAQDYTEQMQEFARLQRSRLVQLDGFILKKSSPSCGLERLSVEDAETGHKVREGTGLFARFLQQNLPLLPLEEEGRLNDPHLRDGFFERVFAHHRWRSMADIQSDKAALERFHASHKLQLMARGDSYYRELGQLVADPDRNDQAERAGRYFQRFMQVMTLTPSRGRMVNVLQHVMGFFKQQLDAEDKRELLELFEAYREQRVSLQAPLTLLRHHLRRHPHEWLAEQHLFAPYPDHLAPQGPI